MSRGSEYEGFSEESPLVDARPHFAAAVDRSSSVLVRRALLITNFLAVAGAGLGLIAIRQGAVTGAEIVLINIWCCLAFASGMAVTLVCFRNVALKTVAIVSTVLLPLIGKGLLS